MDETSLSVRTTVADLVAVYEQSAADIRRAFGLLDDAEARINAAFTLGDPIGSMHLQDRHGRTFSWGDPEDTIARLRLSVWSHLVERLELRRFLSVKRAKELDDMLDGKGEETFPEITIENVFAFAKGFQSQAEAMLREAVEEVFEFLRPHRSEYKRNSEFEVPRRIVLRNMVERKWSGNGFRVGYQYAQPRLTALQNVFSSLDGKGMIPRTHYGALHDAIERCTGGVGETEFFKFRCFKNRNLHLEFKRLDLLDRFNAMAGGKRLRPATEAA